LSRVTTQSKGILEALNLTYLVAGLITIALDNPASSKSLAFYTPLQFIY
jgi:hypothetical protein